MDFSGERETTQRALIAKALGWSMIDKFEFVVWCIYLGLCGFVAARNFPAIVHDPEYEPRLEYFVIAILLSIVLSVSMWRSLKKKR
jgi:hypothetical protein